jgi:hypothetical protein
MNKTQAWMIIGLLLGVIALWGIRNMKEGNARVKRTSVCISQCDREFDTNVINQQQWYVCENACYTKNGLSAPWAI